jgi:hypothetical protein
MLTIEPDCCSRITWPTASDVFQRARDVEVEHGGPLLVGHLERGCVVASAGVVDKHINPVAERVLGLFGHRGDLAVVGDVGGDGDELVSSIGYLGCRGIVGLGPSPGNCDLGAGLRQTEGECLAQALVAAGDQGGLAGEVEE